MKKVAITSALVLLSGTAFAQSAGFGFNVSGGARYLPEYEGSDEYEPRAFGVLGFDYLTLPNGFTLGTPGDEGPETGLLLSPTLHYIREIEANDYDERAGLDDVDATIELGMKVGYRLGFVDGYVKARYGFFGHEGVTLEFGGNYYASPSANTRLEIGPRIVWVDDNYMDTYFSVSDEEASRSQFDAYSAGSGVKSVGLEANFFWDFTDVWTLEAGVRYDQLSEDAADSPIVRIGAEDQITSHINITRKFDWRF